MKEVYRKRLVQHSSRGNRAGLFAALVLSCPLAAMADGGSVTGAVEVTPAKFLEETVIYLTDAPGKAAPKTVQMDQKGLRFLPHVLAVNIGDTVHFANHDAVNHNIFSPDQGGYNLGTFGAEQGKDHTFTKPGLYIQLCALHPEMQGFVFASPTPYSAVVDRDGKFTLANVPPGTYHVAVWNAHLKAPEQTVTVAAGKPAEVRFSLKR